MSPVLRRRIATVVGVIAIVSAAVSAALFTFLIVGDAPPGCYAGLSGQLLPGTCNATPSAALFEAFLRWSAMEPMYSNLAVWTMEIATWSAALWCLSQPSDGRTGSLGELRAMSNLRLESEEN